jgi:hypothetical protein
MGLESILNIPKKQSQSTMDEIAKILGVAIQLGGLAATGAQAFGAGAPESGMVPASVGSKYNLLSDQDWMKYFGSVPTNRGVGFPGMGVK